ncbi:MAG: hypothetical protein H8E47_03870 [Anaerolineales bacterium]|nr:hypothetical protein [Anaerolineales bacterium]
MRGRRFRPHRRPFFRPRLWRPRRLWRPFGCGLRGMGCLLYPLLGVLAIFLLAFLIRLIF